MFSTENNLRHFIRKAKLRLMLRDLFQAMIYSVMVCLSAFLFAPLFHKILGGQFQLSFEILLIFILIFLVLRIINVFRQNLNHSQFYQSLKSFLSPGLTDDIYSAEELMNVMENKPEPLFAKTLAYAHIDRVNENLKGVNKNPITILSSDSLRMLKIAGILILLLFLANTFFWNAYKKAFAVIYYSLPQGVEGIVNSVDINYIYPAYTGLPPVELKNTDGNIQALKGTTAELKFFLRVESDKCEIFLNNDERFLLQGAQGFFYGSIIVATPGTYYFGCMLGKKFVKDRTQRTITINEDEYPEIDAYLMKKQEVISPHDNILFSYSARDDFGLQKILFSCETSSGERYSTTVKEPSIVSGSINGEFLWNTEDMNLKKGREITCYLSAFDNDTISGPKEGRSQIFHFKVGALDSRERLLEDIRALFEGFVKVLADVLERQSNRYNSKFLSHLREELSGLENRGKEILNSLTDKNNEVTEVLNRVIFRTREVLTALKDRETGNKNTKRDFDSITEKLEETVLSLYTLIKYGRYELFISSAEDILSSQQSILEEFKNGDAEGIYKKIQKMEESLAEMFAGLSSTAGGFSEEFINMDALKEMGSFSLFNKLNEIKSLLRQGKIGEAKKLYEEFMSEYAKMLASMQELLRSTTMKEFADFMRKLDELQSEVKTLTSREAKIKSALKNLEPEINRDIHEWLKEEIKKVNRLINKIDMMENRTHSLNLQNPKEARRRAELIKISLAALNLFDALTEAKNSLQSLEMLNYIPDFTKDESLKTELKSAIELNKEIINDIEKVLKNLSAKLDKKSKEKLKTLAKEQEDIEKRTRELSEEFQKSQSSSELMKTPIPDMLSGAADFMKGAKNRMEEDDPSGGLQNASEAIKQLGKIDDYIENMKSGSGLPMPVPLFGYRNYGSGYGSNTGRVELPGEQESAYQKEIKEELLRAIRGGLPEELEEENRKYIEELMK